MVNVDGAIGPAIAYLEGQLPLQPDGSPGHWGLRVLRESIGLLAGQDIDINLLRAGLDGAFAMRSFATAADLAKVINIALLVGNGSEPALSFLHEQVARFDEAEASSVALEFLAEVVQVDVIAGRLDDAVSDADELAERPAPRRARQAAAIFRGVALAALGRLDDADEALRTIEESVTGDWFGRGELLAAQAQVALWSGRAARAIELIDTAIAIPSPIVGGHILPQLTRAWASVEVGAPFETIDAPIRSLAGATPEFEGLRLLAANQADAAADRFAEAAALWDGFQALRMMTCRWAEGEALRQSGSPSAADRLTVALEAAEACRFESLAVRVRRSLRLAGIRVAAGDRRSYAVAPRLTGRERELVELVGHGLTNLEIARRMGLGRPTVSRILSNAMGKLGAESRAHAVALASELD
jgi:DNA-binding CsgD family transcriptional regulator/tetratricopeptide (TPR) repeat protein